MKRNLAIRTIASARLNSPEKFRAVKTTAEGEILLWDEAVLGTQPTEAEIGAAIDTLPDSVLPVPQAVTSWRLRAVASLAGHKEAIEAVLDGLPEPNKTIAKEAWASGLIRRNAPLIAVIGAALEMDKAAIDGWFREAAAIHD